MKVKVANNLYRMSKNKYKRLLEVASEQVSFGIYAVEKGDYAELRNDKCNSITQIKNLTRQYRQQGFKVHQNGR